MTSRAVQHLDPARLHNNPAFTNVVVVEPGARIINIGGQNALDPDGNVIGRGDFTKQTQQVFQNLETALAAAGARLEDVIRWNIYVLHGQPMAEAFEVFQSVWGSRGKPPAITVVQVAGLANPEALIEIEAVAVTESTAARL